MEDGDLDAWSNVTEPGETRVRETSYSESISTIAPQPNRVSNTRLNWNMLYTPIYTPPTLYLSGLHVTVFCKLCPLPPLLSGDVTCSNLSDPLGTTPISLLHPTRYFFKIIKWGAQIVLAGVAS